mmetsp:Transcript_120289/g.300052  ORF Transcript_120289/g.300052 Transcript_120289/m.300052 type:complete len:278 (-) Transcript_120289:576-1409(-)
MGAGPGTSNFRCCCCCCCCCAFGLMFCMPCQLQVEELAPKTMDGALATFLSLLLLSGSARDTPVTISTPLPMLLRDTRGKLLPFSKHPPSTKVSSQSGTNFCSEPSQPKGSSSIVHWPVAASTALEATRVRRSSSASATRTTSAAASKFFGVAPAVPLPTSTSSCSLANVVLRPVAAASRWGESDGSHGAPAELPFSGAGLSSPCASPSLLPLPSTSAAASDGEAVAPWREWASNASLLTMSTTLLTSRVIHCRCSRTSALSSWSSRWRSSNLVGCG